MSNCIHRGFRKLFRCIHLVSRRGRQWRSILLPLYRRSLPYRLQRIVVRLPPDRHTSFCPVGVSVVWQFSCADCSDREQPCKEGPVTAQCEPKLFG